MVDLASNPIYSKVIQGARLPSVVVSTMLGLGIALAGGIAIILSLMTWITRKPPDVALILATVGMCAEPLIIAGALISTTLIVARQISKEDFALVRISGLPEKEIIRGLVEGMKTRLEVWAGVSAGLLAYFPILVLTEIFFAMSMGGEGVMSFDTIYVSVAFAVGAILISGVLVFYQRIIWPLFITAGIWATLRSPRSAFLIAAGIALAVAGYFGIIFFYTLMPALFGLSLRFGSVVVSSYRFPTSLCLIGYPIITFIVPYPLLRFLRADCIRLVNTSER